MEIQIDDLNLSPLQPSVILLPITVHSYLVLVLQIVIYVEQQTSLFFPPFFFPPERANSKVSSEPSELVVRIFFR